MASYSIKELEHLSGIKAHTIRIWEQRYNLLSPKRTETNIRYYGDSDLKMLLNVSLLNQKGYKISRIAGMTREQISEEVLLLTETPGDRQLHLNALVLGMVEMDEEKLDRALNKPILQLGFEKAMLDVVYPFLERIGILWQTGNINPAHEHFVSNLIRQKLIVGIDGQAVRSEKGSRFILFLPEGELHELGLLFMHYLLRARGHHVLYLGQNLPLDDLISAQEYFKAACLVSSFTSAPERDQLQPYLNSLGQAFPDIRILVNGYLTKQLAPVFPANIREISVIADFISYIEQFNNQTA